MNDGGRGKAYPEDRNLQQMTGDHRKTELPQISPLLLVVPPLAHHAAAVPGVDVGEVIRVVEVQVVQLIGVHLEQSFGEQLLCFVDFLLGDPVHRFPECLGRQGFRCEAEMIRETCCLRPGGKRFLAGRIDCSVNSSKQEHSAAGHPLDCLG